MKYTGIRYHRGRVQPFTVWCNGYVEGFSVHFSDAEPRLIKAMQRELSLQLQRRGDAAAMRQAFAGEPAQVITVG